MRQTLCYIPETLFGLPLFGWGLGFGMLLAALVIAHCYQYFRYRKITDIGGSIVLLVIGSIMLVFVLPNLAEPEQGVPIRGYGVCLLVAIFAGLTLLLLLAKRQNIAAETVFSLCFWSVIAGIAGARFFYVTEYWRDMFLDHAGQLLPVVESLKNVFNIAGGGLTVFGSILGGIAGSLIFMRRNKMPVLRTFDMMAPAMALGMCIGRLGCLLNGCCFGGVTDVAWGISFPAGSPAHFHQFAHGDVFLYGLKFEEKTIGKNAKQKFLTIAEVLPNSDAESLGLKPSMFLRSISSKYIDGKYVEQPMPLPICTGLEAANVLTHLQQQFPDEKVRFDFYVDSSHAKAFYLSPTPLDVLPVHPTQIYSSCLALLLCGTLLLLGRLHFYQQRGGLVFASFMILYSVGRFLIEIVRTDEDSFFGTGLTISQNVSIIVGLTGIALFVYLCGRKELGVRRELRP
jgi:phosphatidylglycerol:prolipoprotein diacylglycerol transferase